MSADVLVERRLTGTVAPERVRELNARVPAELVERLLRLDDLSATVSDVLDMLGIEGAVGATDLAPVLPGARVVGTAVTVRKVPKRTAPAVDAAAQESDMGEIEGANQARPGDVLVIQGLPGVSAMGGLMSTMARRQGCAGAVIDGGFRDLGHARRIEFPVWTREVTPVTGKWRSEVAEVNGPVSVRGRIVNPGDLVIADETGVCFVPGDRAEEVVQRVEAIALAEESYHAGLATDVPLDELVRAHRGSTDG